MITCDVLPVAMFVDGSSKCTHHHNHPKKVQTNCHYCHKHHDYIVRQQSFLANFNPDNNQHADAGNEGDDEVRDASGPWSVFFKTIITLVSISIIITKIIVLVYWFRFLVLWTNKQSNLQTKVYFH